MLAMELEARLAQVGESEARFSASVAALEEADLEVPSLCPGWSRGHVIAHVALNAHSIVNLMTWARTGEETPQYAGAEQRNADIDHFASRTIPEHLRALEEATAAYLEAARGVPLDRWDFELHGIGGDRRPVAEYLFGRVGEVEIHHVDLAGGYDSSDWPEAFVVRMLHRLPGRFGSGMPEPVMIHAADLGLSIGVGEGRPAVRVSGPGHALLKWALGRSKGADLTAEPGDLPVLPPWG